MPHRTPPTAFQISNFLRSHKRIFGIIVAFRGGNPPETCSLTYSRAHDGPGPAARKRGVRQGRVATSVDVRNLAYLALIENDQISLVKPSMWDALRGQSAWRVLYLCLTTGAWSCLDQNMDFKARHVFFSAPRRGESVKQGAEVKE